MNINKYNRPKSNSTEGRAGTTATLISGGGTASEVSTLAKQLAETHLIFGLPFNGTLDVAGDITNAQNITTSGGDINVKATEDAEGVDGGNIYADVDILAGNNVIGKKFIGDVEAENVDTTYINADSGKIGTLLGNSLKYDSAAIKEAVIDALTSVDITTENLTVTKLAHFFELIIDKIKAAGGAILLTPADGFKVDNVVDLDASYRVLWRATDGERAIKNMWQIGDLAICQTFNAAEGTSYNVSNKYYWALVVGCGSTTIGDVDYHYIDLSKTDIDGTLNPEVGDEIAMLGYRGTDDENRQSAIYLAAYNSIDPTLKAPLICHYKGINDFNLKNHKYTFFAANGSEIRGNLKVESGLTIGDYIKDNMGDVVDGKDAYLHTAYANSADGLKDFTKAGDVDGKTYSFIGLCSDHTESDAMLIYSDYLWSRIKEDAITIVSAKVEYATSNSGTTAPADGWSETIPYTPPSHYLWTKTTINYSDGTETISYSVGRFGANGGKGDLGDSGKDGSSYTDNLLIGTLKFEGSQWKNLNYWTDAGEDYMGCKVLKREANTYGIYLEFLAIAGETYTFSAYVKSDGGDVRYYFTLTDGTGVVTPLLKDVPESSEWTRLAVSFKCTQSGTIGCRMLKASGTGAIYVAGLKLEYGANSNTSWNLNSAELKGDKGDKGLDADYYKLIPIREIALVDINDTLGVDLCYKPVHIVGDTATEVELSIMGFDINFNTYPATATYTLNRVSPPYYTNANFMEQFSLEREPIKYLSVSLFQSKVDASGRVYGENLDTRIVPITLLAGVTFTITDLIKAKVLNNYNTLNGKITTNTNNISTLTLRADKIETLVSKNTTAINNLDGSLQETKEDVSRIEQTAESILLSVTSLSNKVNYDLNNRDNWAFGNAKTNVGAGSTFEALMSVASNSVLHFNELIPLTDETYIKVNDGYFAYVCYFDMSKRYICTTEGWFSGEHKLTKKYPYAALLLMKLDNTAISLSDISKAGIVVNDVTIASSLIKLTANEILLKVDDVALLVTDLKIVLDGDTEINGSLVMDDTDLGFILKGDGGTTTISPQSLGSYADFSSKTTNTFRKTGSVRTYIGGLTSYRFSNTQTIGYVKSGVYLILTNAFFSSSRYNGVGSVGSTTIDGATYSLYVGDTLVLAVNVRNGATNFLTLTTTLAGEYKVKMEFTVLYSGNFTEPVANISAGFSVILPTDAYMLIGYDGLAANFGNNKTIYFGDEGAYLSYGDFKLKVDSSRGILKYAGSNADSYQNKGELADTCTSHYLLEYAPIGGCVVREIKSGGRSYLLPNDEFIVYNATGAECNFYLPNAYGANVGRRIYFRRRLGVGVFKVNGTIIGSGNSTLLSLVNIGDSSLMFISDGSRWILYYCG